MAHVNSLVCPNCRQPLTSVRAVRIGKKITCRKCGVAFIVRPEDAGKGGGVNIGRLGIVLAVALVYLLGGAGLALYCLAHDTGAAGAVRADSDNETDADDAGDITAPVPGPAVAIPSAIDPKLERKIDAAIAAGVWYLRDQELPGGGWRNHSLGYAALPGLTLLECGIPGNDPIIQRAAALVRKEALTIGGDGSGTYQLALAILFLDRLAAYEDDELIRYLALCLIAGQDPESGAWHYQCPMLERKRVAELAKALEDEKQSLADWRNSALAGNGFATRGWDNSNTQFAILALWVAKRHQIAIDKPIKLVEKHFRATQMGNPGGAVVEDTAGNNVDLNGSWYYDTASAEGWRNSSRWPSMTCSGLLGLAIGHGVTKDSAERKQKPLDDVAIQRGLAMLAREIARNGDERPPDFYFLWSLQRVGAIFELNAIDGKDWYLWGANVLLPRQNEEDGSWHDGGYVGSDPILDTCFALLFLKRANLAKDLTDKLKLLASVVGSGPPSVQPKRKE